MTRKLDGNTPFKPPIWLDRQMGLGFLSQVGWLCLMEVRPCGACKHWSIAIMRQAACLDLFRSRTTGGASNTNKHMPLTLEPTHMAKYSVHIVPWKNALPQCSVLPFSDNRKCNIHSRFMDACSPRLFIGPSVGLILPYILGTKPTAQNWITKIRDLWLDE